MCVTRDRVIVCTQEKWEEQECEFSELEIVADTPDIAGHAAVVEQLSRTELNDLHLTMLVPFTLELQAL